jgi:hypothetical protein
MAADNNKNAKSFICSPLQSKEDLKNGILPSVESKIIYNIPVPKRKALKTDIEFRI